jgi:hypothetical protein
VAIKNQDCLVKNHAHGLKNVENMTQNGKSCRIFPFSAQSRVYVVLGPHFSPPAIQYAGRHPILSLIQLFPSIAVKVTE